MELPEVHDPHLVMPPWPKIVPVLSSHLVILGYLVPPNLSSYIFQRPRAEFFDQIRNILLEFPIYGSRNNLRGENQTCSIHQILYLEFFLFKENFFRK